MRYGASGFACKISESVGLCDTLEAMPRRSLVTPSLCSLCLLLGFVAGTRLEAAKAQSAPQAAPSATEAREVDPTSVAPAPLVYSRYRKLDMFARALAIIEQYYVRPIDDQELIYAAIRGLVAELDPHTAFLPPPEAKLLREDIEGAFGGVGMTVILGRDDDGTRYLDVRDVIADGPADRANITVGNRITAIEGQPIAQFVDLQKAISTIRGKPDTSVQITVEDATRGIVRSVVLQRAIIHPPAVEVRSLGQGIGVLRLRDFPESATREVKAGIETLRDEAGKLGLRGLVLDLRDNGGGLLDEAVRVVDLFVAEGPIVRTRGRRETLLDEARAHRPGTDSDTPLVVLVNKASASASEIVAGALQDHGRALIVGERTYGKGSVQAPFELEDGSLLKLTTALYYTPDDRLIQASGITPDVFVGVADAGVLPRRDSRPDLEREREQPRHLEPEAFGRPSPSLEDEGPALLAASDDVQLRTAVQHLQAWSQIDLTKGRRR